MSNRSTLICFILLLFAITSLFPAGVAIAVETNESSAVALLDGAESEESSCPAQDFEGNGCGGVVALSFGPCGYIGQILRSSSTSSRSTCCTVRGPPNGSAETSPSCKTNDLS